ncbi:unnamed protein product [Thlaspi arvense]|uniref:O-fucosyltransferase family protein n=1 Tax=Thlaspi arvense TaxID=13288 RepID=A0AAU9RXY8_THLAR|nr:unnamed protein product [Thlaspi arvense]
MKFSDPGKRGRIATGLGVLEAVTWSRKDYYHFLDGVVKVAENQPADILARNLAVVRIPNQVTEKHIAENVEPLFRSKGNVRLASYFPSVNMRKTDRTTNIDSVSCLAMFGTLELQAEVHEVVDSVIERLRTLSRKSGGQFVAVDMRVEVLEKEDCQGSGDSETKSCYSPEEVALFLRKIGFDKDTTIYVTQSRWDSSLDTLKDFFPKTYTKKGKKVLDFCLLQSRNHLEMELSK